VEKTNMGLATEDIPVLANLVLGRRRNCISRNTQIL